MARDAGPLPIGVVGLSPCPGHAPRSAPLDPVHAHLPRGEIPPPANATYSTWITLLHCSETMMITCLDLRGRTREGGIGIGCLSHGFRSPFPHRAGSRNGGGCHGRQAVGKRTRREGAIRKPRSAARRAMAISRARGGAGGAGRTDEGPCGGSPDGSSRESRKSRKSSAQNHALLAAAAAARKVLLASAFPKGAATTWCARSKRLRDTGMRSWRAAEACNACARSRGITNHL